MSRLLEFFLGSILIATFTVALMFFSVVQYVLKTGDLDDCPWYGSVRTWVDSNDDGRLDHGESPLSGVEIHVDDVRNGLVDAGWPAITDEDGSTHVNVSIPSCLDTVFEVYVDIPDGYRMTTEPRIEIDPEILESLNEEPVYYFGFRSAP